MEKSNVLILGAGGIGGYFGGRLAEAGLNVTFLVRNNRQKQLAQNGLIIKSQFGDAHIQVNTISSSKLILTYDYIIIACKAYDLESAIQAITPAVGETTVIMPLLNGIAHIELLNERFGKEKVLGGSAKIQVTMNEKGEILHLNDWRYLTFGEQSGEITKRVNTLANLFKQTKGVEINVVNDVMQQMWEKLVHLSTAAAMTCMMRANVGEIVRTPEGKTIFLQLLETNAMIASSNGYSPSDSFMETYRAIFSDPTSAYATSMLRDIERKNRIEADHIVGFMLNKAVQANIESVILHLAYTHLKAYEQRILSINH